MSNCGDICERCGDKIESCDCDPDPSKDAIIDLLVNYLVGTVKQWAIEDQDDEIATFIRENLQFDKLDYEDLYQQAEGAGLV
jgi:hypothetical protein